MKLFAKNTHRCFVIVGLLLLSACASNIEITHYPIPEENRVPQLKAYCWAGENDQGAMGKISPTGGHHSDFDAGVRASINATLTEKGYHSGPCETADFMIDYRMGIHTDVATADVGAENVTDASSEEYVHEYGAKWTFDKQADIHYEGLAEPEETLIIVRHGTLHVAAFTPAGKILWHSSAEKVLNERNTDAERMEAIKKAAGKTMENFPSQP